MEVQRTSLRGHPSPSTSDPVIQLRLAGLVTGNLEIDCKNCPIVNWYEGGNIHFDSSLADGLEHQVKSEWQVSRILARYKKIKEGRNV